jgi:hypothetical protein
MRARFSLSLWRVHCVWWHNNNHHHHHYHHRHHHHHHHNNNNKPLHGLAWWCRYARMADVDQQAPDLDRTSPSLAPPSDALTTPGPTFGHSHHPWSLLLVFLQALRHEPEAWALLTKGAATLQRKLLSVLWSQTSIEPHHPWSPLLNFTIPGPLSSEPHHPWSPITVW